MSTPSTKTLPPLISSMRLRQRNMVDLPEPEGPMTQTTSPWLTVKSMDLSTTFSPYCFLRPRTRTFGISWLSSVILLPSF